MFSDDCVLWGSSHTIESVVRKLRQGCHCGPIIVHNADRLTGKLLDLLIDIADSVGFPLVLCGSRRLRQLIMAAPEGSLLEKVRSRIVLDVDLPGPSIADARLLGDELCYIKIDTDLVEHFFKGSGSSVRGC